MSEINVQDLINMNYRICTLMGIMTSIFIDVKNSQPRCNHYKFDWILDAMNAVIYENKPIPPLPEKDLL